MIKAIVIGFSIIDIIIFAVLALYAVLSIYIVRGFMKDEEETH